MKTAISVCFGGSGQVDGNEGNNKDKGCPRLARLPATNAAHDHAEIQTVGGLSAQQSATFTQNDGRENLEKF